jgi:hypothetical protein
MSCELIEFIYFVVGTIVGLGGGWLLHEIYYRRSWKSLYWSSRADPLLTDVSKAVTGLQVSMKSGAILNDPYRIYITFWNSGDSEIEGKNFSSNDPLVIEFSKHALVECKVHKTSRPSIRIELIAIQQDKYRIPISHLRKDDGFVLEAIIDRDPHGCSTLST